jgi:hypothetical protein
MYCVGYRICLAREIVSIQYLNQQIAKSIIIICHLRFFYMFRPLQGHHQEGIYKGI